MSSLLGGLGGAAIGVAVGEAGSTVLEPGLEAIAQEAWKESQAKIIDLNQLARLVAQCLLTEENVLDDANRNGYHVDQLTSLVQLALNAPPIAQALSLWQRGNITEAEFDHALAKAQIEGQYWAAYRTLFDTRIPADQLAFAHQRGIVDNPKDPVTGELLMPVSPPTTSALDLAGQPSPVRQQPVPLDVLKEFQATGWDFTRAAVNARSRGLPPAPGELLQMINRGIISQDEFYVGIGEGDTRNEWRDYLLALRHPPLSAQEYASARLRTWVTQDESYVGGALTGHTPEQMDLLFLNRGRPASPTQMWTAYARKAIGPRGVPVEYEDHAKAIAISDIRPEYAEMLWQIRYLYPSLFQINRLAVAGTIDPATAADWATKSRYAPEVVAALLTSWEGGSTAAAKKVAATTYTAQYEAGTLPAAELLRELQALGYSAAAAGELKDAADVKPVQAARTKLLTKLHTMYVGGTADVNQALAALNGEGYAQTTIDGLLKTWDNERALIASSAPPPPGPTT